MIDIQSRICPIYGYKSIYIESSIKFLKERLRCLWNGLPFRCVPRVMITTGVAFCIDMVNAPPAGDGISDTLNPATIVTGRELPNVANLQLSFGDYVQLQMDNNPTNTMRPRHIDCIALQPTGTTQGTYYFMDLHTVNGSTVDSGLSV